MSAAAAPLPEPPSPPPNLAKRKPLLRTLPVGASVHRIYNNAHNPMHFDRRTGDAGNRFNAPDGSYGVMYTSQEREGAFGETFLREPGQTLVSMKLMRSKGYVRFELKRELVLLQLYGRGLARVGATAEINHMSSSYSLTQAWSKALRQAFPQIEGIAYTGRHNEQICLALIHTTETALHEAEREPDLMGRSWFARLLEDYMLGVM